MTPKEKANKLVDEFLNMKLIKLSDYSRIYQPTAKQCALIMVDEILKSEPRYPSNVDWDDAGATHQYYYEAQREEADAFWKQVKQEIEKL